MSLIRNVTLALAAAGLAGCASSPAWEKPHVRRLVEQPKEAPKETPKEAPKETPKEVPKETPKPAYTPVTFEVIYEAEDKQTASLIRGYAQLSGKTEFESALAADKDHNGVASYLEISDLVVDFTKEHGGEVKLLPVKDGTQFKYSQTVQLPEKRAAEMKAAYDSAKAYDKVLMLKNWEKTYAPK